MTKAAAPITGGIRAPPEEAVASTAPATCASNPIRFISGMVKVPVVTVLATALPEIVPIIPLTAMEILAGPPLNFPKIEVATSMKNSVPPQAPKKAPNVTKRKMNLVITFKGMPNIPFVVIKNVVVILSMSYPWCDKGGGNRCPKKV